MKLTDIKTFLEEKAQQYESFDFIEVDPIQIPHQFSLKEDIEISGFLAATIAWGNRKSIINNAQKMMQLMDHAPYDFVMNHKEADLARFEGFVHRTFNAEDLRYFIKALRHVYQEHQGLEQLFSQQATPKSLQEAIHHFKKVFFSLPHQQRTQKHVSDPLKGSAAKRLNMYLRWMVRSNKNEVDFGLWPSLHPRQLSCPLDVHSGNVARKLKLLKRKQNDGKALLELDTALRKMDPEDPVKFDYALFGLGVFEKF
ncbi:MAG: TIGR02757 family protein [Candidatus Arcticimaribacter sp.]